MRNRIHNHRPQKHPQEVRVGAWSDPGDVAGSALAVLRQHGAVEITAAGGAISQAARAFVFLEKYASREGIGPLEAKLSYTEISDHMSGSGGAKYVYSIRVEKGG